MKKQKKVPERVKIVVNQRNIRKGVRASFYSCPIALAVKRELGDNPRVEYNGTITITLNGWKYYYHCPKKAARFIRKFDDKEKVEPFSFVARRGRAPLVYYRGMSEI